MKLISYFSILIIILLTIEFIAAQPPPPPPAPPNLGSGGSDDIEEETNYTTAETSDSGLLLLPPPNPHPYENKENKKATPNIECPSPNKSLTYTLLFLVTVLIGVIIFLLIHKNKTEPVIVAEEQISMHENTNYEPKPQYDELQPLRDYVDSCRSKGFNDSDIKLELVKNGYHTEKIKQLF